MFNSDDHLAFLRMVDRLEQFHAEAQEQIWKRFQELSDTNRQQNDDAFRKACQNHAQDVFLTSFFNGLSFGFCGFVLPAPRPQYPVTGFREMEILLNKAIQDHCDKYYSNKLAPL